MEDSILDFLDGRLESYDEEELLHRLAVSPEKRGLLREHMKLREAVSHTSRQEQLTVPCNVTASLYRRLAHNGYAGANLGGSVTVVRPIMPSIPNIAAASKSAQMATRVEGYTFSALAFFAAVSFMLGIGASFVLDDPKQQMMANSSSTTGSVIQKVVAPSLSNPKADPTKAASVAAASWQSVPYEMRVVVDAPSSVSTPMFTEEAVTPAQTEAPLSNMLFSEAEVDPDAGRFTLDGQFANVAQPVQVMPIGSDAVVAAEVENNQAGIVEQAIADRDEAASNDIASVNIREEVFNINPDLVELRTLEQIFDLHTAKPSRAALSMRTGAGKLPGNDANVSGSLSEVRFTYNLSELFAVTASFGEFAPYESIAKLEGNNGNGVSVIAVDPTLTFRYVYGLEGAMNIDPLGMPLTLTAGAMFDFEGALYPRTSITTSVDLTPNFGLLFGAEAVLYLFDVDRSIRSQMSFLQGKNPAVQHGTNSSQLSGFIGPTIEAMWRF